MNKKEVFKYRIRIYKNYKVRKSLETMIDELPDIFLG